MAQVLLSVPPDPAFVRLTRLIAADLARKAGISEDVLDDVRLAVGQACARAVSLHRHQGLIDPVVINFTDDPTVEVTVRDRAPLEAAQGERAAAVLSAAVVNGPACADDVDGAASTVVPEIALLKALTSDLLLTTGPNGSVVRMRWPR